MNKELKKKFDEEFGDVIPNTKCIRGNYTEMVGELTPDKIKSFIDTHFIAKEDLEAQQEFFALKNKMKGLYIKSDLLSMVDNTLSSERPTFMKDEGMVSERVNVEKEEGFKLGYNQRGAEIRERING